MGDFGGAGSSFLNDSGVSMTPSSAVSSATAGQGAFVAFTGQNKGASVLIFVVIIGAIYLLKNRKK
jgi:hypothetical protein